MNAREAVAKLFELTSIQKQSVAQLLEWYEYCCFKGGNIASPKLRRAFQLEVEKTLQELECDDLFGGGGGSNSSIDFNAEQVDIGKLHHPASGVIRITRADHELVIENSVKVDRTRAWSDEAKAFIPYKNGRFDFKQHGLDLLDKERQ